MPEEQRNNDFTVADVTPEEKESGLFDHGNDDGTFTFYIKNAAGEDKKITIPAGDFADSMMEHQNHWRDLNMDYARMTDSLTETRKSNAASSDEDDDYDPIHQIADPNVNVENQVLGIDMEIRQAEEARREWEEESLKKAHAVLQPQQKELLKRRYEDGKTQDEIAAEDGVKQQAISNREGKIRKRMKKIMAEDGITDAYFDRHRRM